jgi:prepilin-type N-terminal cleavage/methylation domain-containing protein
MTNKKKGFTLVEIMIVVLIIGILLAIAVPNFITARANSRAQTIIGNLKQLESAKEQWAMDKGKTSVDDPGSGSGSELVPEFMKQWPTGPVTGTYAANAVNTPSTFNGKNSDEWKTDRTGL